MILIPIDLYNRIRSRVESLYPEEACGLLLGKFTKSEEVPASRTGVSPTDTGARTIELQDTENCWPGDRRKHFEIAPEEMLAAQKSARERDLDIIGVYHSHPDGSPIPSETDRQLAWNEYFYLIVSVVEGRAIDLRAWKLNDDGHFQEETIDR